MSSSQPVLHSKTPPQKRRKEKKSKHISEEGNHCLHSPDLREPLGVERDFDFDRRHLGNPGQSQQNTNEGVSAQWASSGSQWASSD